MAWSCNKGFPFEFPLRTKSVDGVVERLQIIGPRLTELSVEAVLLALHRTPDGVEVQHIIATRKMECLR